MKLKRVQDTIQYYGDYPNYSDDRHKRKEKKNVNTAPIKPYNYKGTTAWFQSKARH